MHQLRADGSLLREVLQGVSPTLAETETRRGLLEALPLYVGGRKATSAYRKRGDAMTIYESDELGDGPELSKKGDAMTAKPVEIAERWKDRFVLLSLWINAGKHPLTSYNTFEFAKEICKLIEELSAAEVHLEMANSRRDEITNDLAAAERDNKELEKKLYEYAEKLGAAEVRMKELELTGVEKGRLRELENYYPMLNVENKRLRAQIEELNSRINKVVELIDAVRLL